MIAALLLCAASLGAVVQAAAVAGATPAQADDGCHASTDGAVFVADSGLHVTHDGTTVGDNPYVDESTLAFPNVTVRASGNASVTVARETTGSVCLRSVDPRAAPITLAPATGPAITVSDPLRQLSYGTVDYDPTATGSDLSYGADDEARLQVAVSDDYRGRTVEAVDVETDRLLAAAAAGDAGTVALELPAGTHRVDLRAVPPDDAPDGAAGESSAPSFDVSIEDTNTPVAAGSTLEVTASVTNTGERAGRQTLTLTDVEGVERDTVTVQLDGGETNDSVTFRWRTAEPGVGEITVASEDDGASVPVEIGEAGGQRWAGELVDYQPSPQTQHVGGFLPLAAGLWLAAIWLVATRDTDVARAFAAVLVVAALRATSDTLHVLVDGIAGTETSIAALNLSLELLLAVAFVRFAAIYAAVDRLRSRRATAALGLATAIGLATIATNSVHGLVFADVGVADAPFTYVRTTAGPVEWAIYAFDTLLLLLGGGLIARTMVGASLRTVWRPLAVVVIGLSLAVIVGLVSMLGQGPVAGYDYDGAAVNYFVLVTTVALVGQGLQRLKSRGAASIVADMEDPVVILDDAWHVVEYNAAAERLYPTIASGRSFDAVVPWTVDRPRPGETTTRNLTVPRESGGPDSSLGALEPAANDGENRRSAAAADEGEDPGTADGRHYVVTVTSVTTDTNDGIGYTVQLADVSDLERQRKLLETKNAHLDRFADALTANVRSSLGDAERFTDRAVDLLESASDPGEVNRSRLAEYLCAIDEALERIDDVIGDVLELVRGSDRELHREPIEFEDAVASAWEAVDATDATLRVESSGRITADSEQFQDLLERLLDEVVGRGDAGTTVRVALEADRFVVGADGRVPLDGPRERDSSSNHSSDVDDANVSFSIAERRARSHGWEVVREADDDGLRIVVTGCDAAVDRAAPPEVDG